jgi:membrane protein YdbS with pleckstrin-like domain
MNGSPIYFGHRAFGSLKKYFLFLIFIVFIIYMIYRYDKKLLFTTVFTWHIHFTVLMLLIIAFLAGVLVLYLKHIEYTYMITTEQLYIKKGIIMADVKNYTYTQVQEASSYQTVLQRLFLWGQLNITMLISYTGQSKIEEAHMEYIHRPKYIANIIIAHINVGKQ